MKLSQKFAEYHLDVEVGYRQGVMRPDYLVQKRPAIPLQQTDPAEIAISILFKRTF